MARGPTIHTPSTSPNSTTTVQDPAGNQSVYTFSGQYQTLLKVYAGAAGGSLIQTFRPAITTVVLVLPRHLSRRLITTSRQRDNRPQRGQPHFMSRRTVFLLKSMNIQFQTTIIRKTLHQFLKLIWNASGNSCNGIGNNNQSAICKKDVYYGSQLASRSVYTYNSAGDLLSGATWSATGYLPTSYTINTNRNAADRNVTAYKGVTPHSAIPAIMEC